MRILIVEDDYKLGPLLEQGLGEEGFETEWVKDGHEAVARAMAADYGLVILDYMLPGKDGHQVAAELRRAGRTTPILLLTARDAPDDLRRAMDAGVNDCMGKPFRFGELVDRIRALTSGDASVG